MHSYLRLPDRTEKKRSFGLTCIHDVSLSVGELQSKLADFADYCDVAKIGVGTAYVTKRLEDKLRLYGAHDIDVYFGGTLFEKFYSQGLLDEYELFMDQYGVGVVEISTGTVDIDIKERVELVKRFGSKYRVLSEVGTKDADAVMSPSQWIDEIQQLLEAGAEYVITEGRNSGTAGVFRPSGEIRTGLVYDIVHTIDPKRLIFEAPTPKSQMYFINIVGPNVNLGNVNANDLLLLETQRVGLRNETFHLKP